MHSNSIGKRLNLQKSFTVWNRLRVYVTVHSIILYTVYDKKSRHGSTTVGWWGSSWCVYLCMCADGYHSWISYLEIRWNLYARRLTRYYIPPPTPAQCHENSNFGSAAGSLALAHCQNDNPRARQRVRLRYAIVQSLTWTSPSIHGFLHRTVVYALVLPVIEIIVWDLCTFFFIPFDTVLLARVAGLLGWMDGGSSLTRERERLFPLSRLVLSYYCCSVELPCVYYS